MDIYDISLSQEAGTNCSISCSSVYICWRVQFASIVFRNHNSNPTQSFLQKQYEIIAPLEDGDLSWEKPAIFNHTFKCLNMDNVQIQYLLEILLDITRREICL